MSFCERCNSGKYSVLKIRLLIGLDLEIKVHGTNYKKARRTLLLYLLRVLKKELKVIKEMRSEPEGFIYHEDSSDLRLIADMTTPASIYQATSAYNEMEAFGHKIRTIRNSLGLTQKQLAKQLKMQRSYVSIIERGRHSLAKHRRKEILNYLEVLSLTSNYNPCGN